MSHGVALLLLAGVLSLPALSQAARRLRSFDLCPNGRVRLVAGKNIKFNKLEKIFICGDPQEQAWEHIPLNQSKFHLGTFLQSRGYFTPVFSEEGESLIVYPGTRSRISGWRAENAPPELKPEQRRRVKGRVLTPKFLDHMENWARSRLQARGYPCAKVESRANVDSGELVLSVDPGPKQVLGSIEVDPIEKLESGVLRRFDAFRLGKTFNNDWLALTERRIEEDGLLQSSYFTPHCDPPPEGKSATVTQHTYAGKPRLLHFGFGVDTEEYVIVKGDWTHARMTPKAWRFNVSAYASYKRQELNISQALYFFKPESRLHFLPSAQLEHRRETNYHYLSGSVQAAMATSWDWQSVGLELTAGPDLNYTDTFRGAQPGLTRFLTLEYDAQLTSHGYEFWQTSPRLGYYVRLQGGFGSSHLLSEISAQRFELDWQFLYNIKGWDPPLFILGVRGGFYGTFMARNADNLAKLPPNYRYYLGGSNNLRGFKREELPGPDGALSAAFASLELRTANWIPFGIQPLAFFDIGVLGDQAFRFDAPVYYSPGFGIRYESPVGVFRTTFAWGMKTSEADANPDNTHFQFFFGFGEEF